MNRTVIIYGDELYHHGILGQKWGKRNGPPYPLDANDHSAAERKAGWRKSLANTAYKAVSSDTYQKGIRKAIAVSKNVKGALKRVGDNIKKEASDRLEYKNEKARKNLDVNKDNKRKRYPFDEKPDSYTPFDEKTEFDKDRDDYQKWKKDKYKNDLKNAKSVYKDEMKKAHTLSDKQKVALTVGAAVVVAGLAAYGTYKISKNNAIKLNKAYEKSVASGKSWIDREIKLHTDPTYGPNRSYIGNIFLDDTINYKNKLDNNLYQRITKRFNTDLSRVPKSASVSLFDRDNFGFGIDYASNTLAKLKKINPDLYNNMAQYGDWKSLEDLLKWDK